MKNLYYVYHLKLNKKKFDTVEKKLSFLSGLIYSDGSFDGDKIIISKANSYAYEVAVEFVKELGFKFSENYKPEYNIPTVQILKFVPSKKYEKYFRNLRDRI